MADDAALSPVMYTVLMSLHATASADVQRALDAHLAATVAEAAGGPAPAPELVAAIGRASRLRDEIGARLGVGPRPDDPVAAVLHDRRRMARVRIEQERADLTTDALTALTRLVGPFPPPVVALCDSIRLMSRAAAGERVAIAARLERLEAEIEALPNREESD